MSLNYNIIETIKLLNLSIKSSMFMSIIMSSILLTIVFIINSDKTFIKYVVLIINTLLVVLILYYYLKDILTFKFANPINNIYFYFFNSIIYLILNSFLIFKTKYKKTNYVFYTLILFNLTYSLYMTHILYNQSIIVIGNIFPMIKFGNIIYIVYYILVIISVIFDKKNITCYN